MASSRCCCRSDSVPAANQRTGAAARAEMLANFDDHLLEELLKKSTRPKKKSPRLKAGIKSGFNACLVWYRNRTMEYGIFFRCLLQEALLETTAERRESRPHVDTPLAQVAGKTYFTSPRWKKYVAGETGRRLTVV